MKEAGELAKNTSILMNVSEFEDVNQATETLISALQAFKEEGQDVGIFSMEIIDKYNEVGNNYAISTSDLAESLTRSSAALVAANNSLEQSIAMTAAANTTIQDPESVGNALKTVSMRIRGVKTELEEAGEDTEGMVTNTAKLQEKIMALTNIDGSGGVNILTRTGEFKSTYDILLEISKVWDKMGDVDQAALLELVAGKTRGSVVAALFQNGDVLENAYASATDASGSAMRELENHLDSIQGRVDLFNNAVQTMWMNFINADVAKFIVDIGTGLIKAVDTVGLLNTAIVGLVAGLKIKHELKKNDVDLLGFIFDVAPEKIKNAPVLQNFVTTVKTEFAKAMGGSVKVNSFDILAELENFDDANNVLGDLTNIFGDGDVTKDQAKKILDSFDDISDATKDAILSSNLFAASQTGAAAGTNTLTAYLTKAKAAAIAFGKGLMSFATAHPVIAGLTIAVIALGTAFGIYKKFGPTHENYIKKLEEETESLKNIQSNLQSVNKELETTKNRIEELQSKGTLSFVEEEELNRLKEQTAELERQEEILLSQEKRARKKQIESALNAAKTDPNLKQSQIDSSNASEDFTATSQFTGSTSTVIDNSATSQFTGGLQYAANQQIQANRYEQYLSKLKTAKENLEAAEKELANTTYDSESKEYKKLEKAVEEAEGRVDEYNNAIQTMNDTWTTEYGEVGYVENATTEAEKQWNEYYRQHQDYIDQWMLLNDGYSGGKATVLDRIFGETGTDIAKEFKKEFENAVDSGKNPADVIEELLANKDYSSAFSGLEQQFGITLDNIKDYFTQTGEFFVDPEFDITKYTSDISSHSAVISEFQDAIQKLGKGTFTMDDFMDLVERFPDLAKGVDISSNAFYGLSRNLNKAIKSRTKDFIDDLKELRKSLVAAGKSTDSIDQLIVAIENMPDDALDDTIEKYSTLADKIDRARVAQEKLTSSMGENPNEGYETRGEALEYMKDAMSKGEIGSESNLWNVAQKYGFTYDSAKTINENADALAKFIATRERWFKTDDDGDDRTNDGYSYEGTENFIQDVEKAMQSEEFKREMNRQGYEDVNFKWEYDETTGQFDFDFDNADWDKIVTALGKTQELAGLTSDEFSDLMIQVGQYFNINWGDADDVSDYINKIADGSGTASDKIDQMTDSVETYIKKALGTDLDLTTLTETSIEALNCDESIKELLKTYLKLKEELGDPLKVEAAVENGNGIEGLLEIKELQSVIKKGSNGVTVINTDAFKTVLKDAGYTEEQIDNLIKKIQEYKNVCEVTPDDPLGLNNTDKSISTVAASLQYLGVQHALLEDELGNPIGINIDAVDLITTLQEKGWSKEKITSYLQTLTSTENGLGVQVDGQVNMDTKQIDEAITKANEIPTTKEVVLEVSGDGPAILHQAVADLNAFGGNKTARLTTYETKYKKAYVWNPDKGEYEETPFVNGTAHAQGTAYKGGSWGAQKTETALVGELGPELLVRNGRWTTIGANGAEFTQVKKGDIIFNHKQTESLLKNGYVTGRGKAYASGTAYASGGGTYYSYDFSGNGGYTKYDVNGNVADRFGTAASDLSGAADDVSDAADEFREVFDWIEVRLEEISEVLDLKGAKLENAVGYSNQNSLINEIIETNKVLYNNLIAGADKYYSYASGLLEKIPAEYREAAQNGAIAIEEFVGEVDEKTLEAIQEYREWVQKGADVTRQAEETITEIANLAKEAFDNIVNEFDNKTSIGDSKIDQFDAYNALAETDLGSESIAIYEAMIEENNKKISTLTSKRDAMQAELNKRVESGEIEKYSQAWYDAVNEIAAVDTEIINLTADTENYQDAINELHWEHFDNLIGRLEAVSKEAQNLIDILGEQDAFDEAGNWTDAGVTSLGLYAQQMETAEMQAKKYEEEINYLNKNWQALGYTEEEYIAKLEELKDGQYDAIKAYQDSKKAIADLTKERVEAIKEGIEKEIDAYDELINKKKEALDTEKDAYDFQKSVAEQQKNISDIERQIAALSSDNSASARAKRARLEAELAAEKEKLNEMYYDRSVENQKDALDKEAENYRDARNKEIEGWDEYLKNTEKVVADSLAVVQENTKTVYKTLQDMGKEYGLSIAESITSPWKDGEKAIQSYSEKFGLSMSSTVEELQEIAKKYKEFIDEIEDYGSDAVKQTNSNAQTYQEADKKAVVNNQKDNAQKEEAKTIKVGGKINAGNAKIYSYVGDTNGAKQYYSSDPIYQVLAINGNWVQVRHKSLKSGITGWFRKSDVNAYASGTTGVLEDQLAIIDELGEELIIRPQNGKLTYMTKGSGVVPADLTENLMKWGAIDPSTMLERSKPQISASPSVVNNTSELKIDASVGTLLHVEHIDGSNPAEITKIVDKAWDNRMKELNGFIRKYSR